MATGPVRPPWFGNRGVQLLAGAGALYNAVQLVLHLVDGQYGSAFLSFAWGVVFAYVAVESWRYRTEQDALDAKEGPAPTGGPAPTD